MALKDKSAEDRKGVDVIVRLYSNNLTRDKDGKITNYFANVEVDGRDPLVRESVLTGEKTPTGKDQRKSITTEPNLSLVTRARPGKDGGPTQFSNNDAYAPDEVRALINQAKADGNYFERKLIQGDGSPKLDKSGKQVTEILLGANGDLPEVPVTDRNGKEVTNKDGSPRTKLRLDVATLAPHSKGITADAIKYQIEAKAEARAYKEENTPAPEAKIESHEAAAPAEPAVEEEAAFA